jgi:DNA mismatch repair protein MSH3
MREWIGRPLLDIGYVSYNALETRLIDSALQARIDAIEEIINEKTYHMEKLRGLLVNIPDLVKGLTRIQYGKVSIPHPNTSENWFLQAQPTEVATILISLKRVGDEFKSVKDEPFDSALLNNILRVLPSVRESSKTFLDAIHTKAAQENDESGLWTDPDKYPDVQDAKDVCLPDGVCKLMVVH